MRKTLLFAALLASLGQAAQADAGRPGIYGLVVGINLYQHYDSLTGAVNDAREVASALRERGAKEVVELMDEKASRANIAGAWARLAAQAKPGDVVVFAYAGHGAQLPERIRGNEKDGRDELFVLGGFEEQGPGSQEIILDDDLQAWFGQRPDIKIVLLADSCHSGTMTRGYGKSRLKNRFVKLRGAGRSDAPLPAGAAGKPEAPLPNVVSLSAVADEETDPEFSIEGQTHGAMSWYFAKGVRGAADLDRDGRIRADEMGRFLAEKVKAETSGQQHPQFENADERLLAEAVAKKDGQPPPAPSEALLPFGFGEEGQDAALAGFAKAGLKHIQPVEPGKAELEWDMAGQTIKNRYGDVVYRFAAPASAPAGNTKAFKRVQAQAQPDARQQAMIDQAQAVVDKFVAVETFKQWADGSLSVALKPDDKLHKSGEQPKPELVVDGLEYPYFTLFNLASDGSVNFLYPSQAGDPPTLPQERPYSLSLDVSEPFGADHFVAIASDRPLTELHQALKQADGGREGLGKVLAQLQAGLGKGAYQIGLHATFTAP